MPGDLCVHAAFRQIPLTITFTVYLEDTCTVSLEGPLTITVCLKATRTVSLESPLTIHLTAPCPSGEPSTPTTTI